MAVDLPRIPFYLGLEPRCIEDVSDRGRWRVDIIKQLKYRDGDIPKNACSIQ